MVITKDMVQALYVAYFSRPADAAGLEHWFKALTQAEGNPEQIAAAFAASDEYQATFADMTNLQIVNAIYNNLFGRDAEPAGLLFWAQALDSGAMTVADAVLTISNAAVGADADIFSNKVKAASAFTGALDTTREILGYSGEKANAAAREWLSHVTDDASLEAAIEPGALDRAVDEISDIGNTDAGNKFELTNGIDTLTGGDRNDTFTAVWNGAGDAATTLTPLDVIDGGAGRDTLNLLALDDLAGLPSVTVKNVEVVNLRGAGSIAADVSNWDGVEKLNVTEAHGNVAVGAGAATDIVVNVTTDAAKLGTIAVEGGKDVTVRAHDVLDASQAINVGTGGKAATGVVTVEATGAAAVNDGEVTMGNITITGGSTINVTQNAAANTTAMTGDYATHTQGDVLVTGDASTTTVNVKQTAAQAGKNGVPAVAEVKETATVKFVALAAGQAFEIAGLVFEATRDLTAAEVAQAFANLVAGTGLGDGDTQGGGVVANGRYYGTFNGWTSGSANGDTVVFTSLASGNVTNLSVIGYDGAPNLTPVTVDGVAKAGQDAKLAVIAGKVTIVDNNGTIKNVTVDGYGAGSEIKGSKVAVEQLSLSNSAAAFDVLAAADTLGLQLEKIGASAGHADLTFGTAPATLNVTSVGNNFVNLGASRTETLNIAGTGTLSVGSATLGGLKAVKVSGSAGLDASAITLGAATIDASATTGDMTVNIDASATTYTGGAGVDKVTLQAAGAALEKALKLGAGNDVLDASAVATADLSTMTGSFDGGEGTDTLKLAAAAAQSLSASAAFEGKISGFERLSLGMLGANAAVNLDNLDDINYVIANGASGAYTLTLDQLQGNATLELAAGSDVVMNLADTSGASDVVNIVVSSASASKVTANGVETINVSATSSHTLTLAADAAKTIVIEGKAAGAVGAAGTQEIVLDASTKAVTLIDGSKATSNLVLASSTAGDAVAVTLKGGAGNDTLTASSNKADVLDGGAGNDTLVAGSGMAKLTGGEGNDLFVIGTPSANVNSYATIMDFTKDDLIQFSGTSAFVSAQVELGDTAVFQDYANAVINAVGRNEIGWFQFDGNTYLVVDRGAADGTAGFVDGEDMIVKLVGEIDLGQASFNLDFGTIGLV